MLPRAPGRLYQPAITRLPSLLCLLVATLSLIALTELACRRLPSVRNSGIVSVLEGKLSRALAIRHLDSRNPDSNPQAAPSQPTLSFTLDASSTVHLLVNSNPAIETAAASNYLPAAKSTAPASNSLPIHGESTSTPSPSEFLPVEDTPTSAPGPSAFLPVRDTTSALSSSNLLPIDTAFTSAPAPASSNFVPVIQSSAAASNYLPVNEAPTKTPAPSNFLPVVESSAAPSNFLPVHEAPSNFLPIHEASTSAPASAPTGSTRVMEITAAESNYLPVSPTYHGYPDVSNFLPVVESSAAPSNYLPVHGKITETPSPSNFLPIVESTAAKSNYLPVHGTPTEAPAPSNFLPAVQSSAAASNYLPIHETSPGYPDPSNFLSVVESTAAPSNFLPVHEKVSPAPLPSEFLPVNDQSTAPRASSDFLPISQPTPPPLPLPASEAFLPIPSAKSASRPYESSVVFALPVSEAFMPILATAQPEAHVGGAPFSNVLPLDQTTNGPASRPALATAALSIAPASTFSSNQDAFSPGANIPTGMSAQPARTGVFQGESFSLGSSGIVVIDGTTFNTATPATTTLADGNVVIVGPSGSVRIQNSLEPTAPVAQTGMFQGESFSVGSSGLVIIGGTTFTTATPTTATLADGNIVVVKSDGSILVQNPRKTTAPLFQTGMFQGESFSVGSSGIVVIDGTTLNRAAPTTATLVDGKVVVVWPSGSVSIQNAEDRAPGNKSWVTHREYLIGAIIPTLLAVLFSIPWNLLTTAVKEIEPFYQLQRPDGVTAENSIALDYSASITVVVTFIALKKGHFLVLWSSLISLMVLAVAPLAAETVFIGFAGECTATSGRDACTANLKVSLQAARVLQGILASIAVLTLALAISTYRRRSGVYANPLSIAGLATLFQNSHVIESFQRLNPYLTSSKMIRSALQGHRYRVDSYPDDDGTKSYGFVICHQDPGIVQTNFRTSFRGGKKYTSVSVTAIEQNSHPKPQRTFSSYFVHPASIIAFALLVMGFEIVIIYYGQTGGNTGFERFMSSQSFGVSFLFTAVGVVLKMYWSLLDDEMRNMEPYRQLVSGGVKASDSILLAPHTNPFTGIFYSLRNSHFFNAYISLVAILCEPLIVSLSNIPFKAGLAFSTYQASSYIAIGVLSMMLLGIIWMLCRKRTPQLVRRPDTIASILLYLCGSSMLEDFKNMALMNVKYRDAEVRRWDRSYAMGSVIGLDGVEREGIDESLFVVETAK